MTHAVVTQPIPTSLTEVPTETPNAETPNADMPNAATPNFGTPTIGGSAPQGSGSGVYRGGTYGQSDPAPLPGQRPGGTVYGGQYGLPTSANPEAPIEASGSLTGLILSRGQSGHIQPTEKRSRLTKVLIVGLSALAFVSVIALIVATMAGDIIGAVFRGLLG